MFLLIDYLTGDKKIALISGIAFAFCPFHFARGLGHLNLMSYGWIPIYVLFLMKTFKEDKLRNAIFAGILLFVIFLNSFYYVFSMGVFTLIFLIFNINNLKLNEIKKIGLLFISFILLASPFIINLTKFSREVPASYTATTPFHYFLPSFLHTFFGKEFYADYLVLSVKDFYFVDTTVFVGFTIFAFSFWYANKNLKKCSFWVLIAVLFFLLSIGEYIRLYGINYPTIVFDLFKYIPLFSSLRDKAQFSIITFMSLVVLFSLALKDVAETTKKKWLLLIFVTGLILFEFISIPYITASANLSEFYKKTKFSGNGTVLDIPLIRGGFIPSTYGYLQTIHGMKMFGFPWFPDSPEFLRGTPFIKEVYNLNLTYFSNQTNYNEAYDFLKEYDVEYIILHKRCPDSYEYSWKEMEEGMNLVRSQMDFRNLNYFEASSGHCYLQYLGKDEVESISGFLQNIKELKKTFEDDKIVVYKIEFS
jgi:hypothetical protein